MGRVSDPAIDWHSPAGVIWRSFPRPVVA